MTQYRTFPISIAIDAETLAQLERLALERKSNRSAVIRELIEKAANATPDNGQEVPA